MINQEFKPTMVRVLAQAMTRCDIHEMQERSSDGTAENSVHGRATASQLLRMAMDELDSNYVPESGMAVFESVVHELVESFGIDGAARRVCDAAMEANVTSSLDITQGFRFMTVMADRMTSNDQLLHAPSRHETHTEQNNNVGDAMAVHRINSDSIKWNKDDKELKEMIKSMILEELDNLFRPLTDDAQKIGRKVILDKGSEGQPQMRNATDPDEKRSID